MADPNEGWNAYTSAANLGYLVAENYSAPSCSQICDIHWWGLSLLYDPAYGWLPCDPAGMEFAIVFYAGPGPTNPVCTYTVTPLITALPLTYFGFTAYYFSVSQLVPCCSLTSGWVSIQSTAAAPGTCSFLWITACPGQGDGDAIQVQPDGSQSGTGYDFGVCLTQCKTDCQAGGIPEGEPPCYDEYADNYNGGCNSSPPIFQPLNCGDVICGTAGTYSFGGLEYRDTDWYELNLTQPTKVTWKATGEFPVRLFIIDGNAGCDGLTIISTAYGEPCTPVSLTEPCLPPGTYWFWIGPDVFTGVACDSQYVAEVSCTPCESTPTLGHFSGVMDSDGNLYPGDNNDGWTDPDFGGPWFDYPQWWNESWPDEFDLQLVKTVVLSFDVLTWNNGWVTVAVNWSNRQWTDMQRPPLPSEDQFVVRDLLGTFDVDGHYVLTTTIPFCPPWVSVDVWGRRFWIEGTLEHTCHPDVCVGDLNCDGFIDFGDINPFVLYMSDFAAWQTTFPGCNPLNGDIDSDGTYGQGSFGDISPFVVLMSTGQGPCP